MPRDGARDGRLYLVEIAEREWEGKLRSAGRGGRVVRNARAPTGLQCGGAYFLASAMFTAAR